MSVLETRAYAKLNLSLDVLDRRSDGYHEMRMVMQTVTLSDALRLETGTGKPLSMRSSLGFLPADERNLAAAAALRLCAETGADCGGLSIELDKSIPVCAGLAGGSADAAAVLRGLNRLLGLGLPPERLEAIGARVGSDVPYCVRGGVHAEFTGRNDLTIGGMKFSGNSQYAKHGRLLHHGCIMLDSNLTDVADALRVKQAKFDSKAVKSVRSRVTTINTHAPTPIAMEDFKSALRACAMAGGALEPYTLTAEDMLAVQKLRDGKYVTWAWNYGFSPPYDMRREARFPAGLVTAHLRVKQGCIQAVRFYGDFFGSGPLEELEAAMAGLPLDAQLAEALAPLHVEHYMSGITAEELARLLRG